MSKKKYYDGDTYQEKRENRISFNDNDEQKELVRLIRDSKTKVIFCTGNAGTGKTFTTVYASYELVREKRYDHIVYTRNPVQLGEEIGFLPGSEADKTHPFMAGLYDNFNNIERLGGPLAANLKEKTEIAALTFLRGRSLEQIILIVDEAQNLDLVTLKAILTRVGEYCKVVLLGSLNQIDDPKQARKDKCDFEKVMERLEEFDFTAHVHLVQSKRSKICSIIDEALRDIK